MRIVSVNLASEWGGAERYTRDLLAGLARRGHEVVLVARRSSTLAQRARNAGLSVIEADPGLQVGWHSRIGFLNRPLNWCDLYGNPLRLRFESILERACSPRTDVLHAQHIKEKLWATAFGIRNGIKVAWTVHAPLEPWMKESAPGFVHAWARERLDGLIAVCRTTLDDYLEWGFRPDAQAVVYNGIDLTEYSQGDCGAAREELGLEEDAFVALVLARPYPGKGIDCLIDAVEAGMRSRPDLFGRLRVIVAGGSSHVRRYDAIVARKGLSGAIRFLGHRDDVPRLLAASDCSVLPSLFEGLPYAISEAMAASLPVIASRVGGIPEMVVHGRTGLVVEPGDTEDLRDALTALLADPIGGRAMGREGRTRAERMFAESAMLDGSEAFFKRLVA